MKEGLRTAVIPAYILLCIVMGGSAQGIWANLALQLIAIAIIAWSVIAKPPRSISKSARALFLIAGLVGLLFIAQLIPLPPELWSRLPGRSHIMDGLALLDRPAPWLPISLTPYDTMATAMTLLPPIAVLMGVLVAHAYRSSWIYFAILIGTLAAVLLGALQVAGPPSAASPWYFYSYSNFGVATGFFANSNHMAALILVSIPILIALIAELRDRSRKSRQPAVVALLTITGIITLLASIVLNGSFAVLLLGPPVLLASSIMLIPRIARLRLPVMFVILGSVAFSAVIFTPIGTKAWALNQMSFDSREKIWATTVPAIKNNWTTGLGISSFPKAFQKFEDPSNLERRRANHAHNDYLEILFETGISGLLLLIFFFMWWVNRLVAIWRSPVTDRYAQAATIASAALLVHSIVDYPLRTAALSAIMAACLCMIASHTKLRPKEITSLHPSE